jgi:hypothetical protein
LSPRIEAKESAKPAFLTNWIEKLILKLKIDTFKK